MPKAASARRYAQAVFQIALEKDQLDGWLEDLAVLARELESPGFAGFLDAPQVPVTEKIRVVADTLGDAVDPLGVNLLSLLASRTSAGLLPSIVEEYQRLLDRQRGIERAEVASAVPLDDEQRQRVVDLLEGIVAKKVELAPRVEPEIIGGIIARVGDRVIDGSARTKLREMRRSLA